MREHRKNVWDIQKSLVTTWMNIVNKFSWNTGQTRLQKSQYERLLIKIKLCLCGKWITLYSYNYDESLMNKQWANSKVTLLRFAIGLLLLHVMFQIESVEDFVFPMHLCYIDKLCFLDLGFQSVWMFKFFLTIFKITELSVKAFYAHRLFKQNVFNFN